MKLYSQSELTEKMANLKSNKTLKVLRQECPGAYFEYVGLRNKLAELKKLDNGQVITMDHLNEFKGLAIWAIKQIQFRERGQYMTSISMSLKNLEARIAAGITFSSIKNLKNTIVKQAKYSAVDAVSENLCKLYGLDDVQNGPEDTVDRLLMLRSRI